MFKNIAGSISGLTDRMGPIVKIGAVVAIGFVVFKFLRRGA